MSPDWVEIGSGVLLAGVVFFAQLIAYRQGYIRGKADRDADDTTEDGGF